MTKRPTIKELFRGRLIELPRQGEASHDARIAILHGNLRVMGEEIGRIPYPFPQSDAEVQQWIDQRDRTLDLLDTAIRGVANLPADTLIPSPFIR